MISEAISTLLACIAMFVLLSCLKKGSNVSKYMGASLLIAGLLLNSLNQNIGFYNLQGILNNLPLLTLILFVPLLSIPLKISGLLDSAFYYMNRLSNSERKMFFSMTSFLALLTPILNLGSVRMLHEIVKNVNLHPRLRANSYFVGFSTAMVWSPYFGSVALVLYYLKLQMTDYIFIGLFFSFFLLLAGNIVYRKSSDLFYQEVAATETQSPDNTIHHKKNIMVIIGMIGSLILSLLVIESLTGISMLLLVSISALVFPMVWGIVTKTGKTILSEMIKHKDSIPKQMNNEIVLFLSAGYFGAALANSEISYAIKSILLSISETSFILIILCVTILVVGLGLIGIHQIISVPIIAMQLDPRVLETAPEILAVLLIMAWSMSSILSPFNAINIIIAQASGKSSFTVGFKMNGIYVLCIFFIGTALIYGLRLLY
jgi:hypothetical protein